jgi:predicted RecB family nuclease
MANKITLEIIDAYLTCRYKGHLKLKGQTGSRSDYENLLIDTLDQIRRNATHRLIANLSAEQVESDVALSMATLKRGAKYIFDAELENERMSVAYHGLKRVPGPSKLGEFHYLPVMFHAAERSGPEQRRLLEILGLILGAVQGTDPSWGLLVYGRDCTIRRIRLRSNNVQAQRILQEIKESPDVDTPPQLMLNRHCEICEFRSHCHSVATSKDDLSLLRSMTESEIKKYVRRGIFTVTQLSCTFRPRKTSKPRKQKPSARQHAVQALAIREKKIHVLGSPELPDAPTRIFLDLEGDPERNFVYLVGMIVEQNGVQERHSFGAADIADELRIFEQFREVLDRNEPYMLYAYGSYEAAFVKRMSTVSGQPEICEKILTRLVNVLSTIHSHFYFPTYSNGLKAIAGYLGFRWTESDASGIQSIVWRRRWEVGRFAAYKDKLLNYNMEDCIALLRVIECLFSTRREKPSEETSVSGDVHQICRVEEVSLQSSRRDWCQIVFAVPDFAFVNQRAYFDYQRDKVFIRTNKILRKCRVQERRQHGKKRNLRPNRSIEIIAEGCTDCGNTELAKKFDGRLARVAYDLLINRTGIRRSVTRITSAWYRCCRCQKEFLPHDYQRVAEYFHSLKSWAMYEYVVHRKSFAHVAETIRDCFGLPITHSNVFAFKKELANYYTNTYERLVEKIASGNLIHADETEIHLHKIGKGYVWIFTNMEEVVLTYRASREGDFLHSLLKSFRGVLVTDFYAAYDSVDCPQQKCLIHLIRDFNQDIRGNPWDVELKSLADNFGKLLRGIVTTIDRYGLKRKYLCKHQRSIGRFFDTIAKQLFRSEVAEGYRLRILKNRTKLFTFIDHDNVPWNNNNAEHAIKHFANFREYADGLVTESGLNDYLVPQVGVDGP